MTYPDYLRPRARELRIEKRLTLDEIVERLLLPRTTIYEWIKDIPLGKPRSTAGQAKRVAAMQAKYRRLREEAYAQGAAEFETLAADRTFRDFVVLYIAEGSKRNRNRVQICNSDPRVVTLSAPLDSRPHHEAVDLLDPVSRRPGSGRAAVEVGPAAGDRWGNDRDAAEVQQRAADRPIVAIGARRADGDGP